MYIYIKKHLNKMFTLGVKKKTTFKDYEANIIIIIIVY